MYVSNLFVNDELTFIGRVTVMVSIVVPIPPPLQLKNKEKCFKANKEQISNLRTMTMWGFDIDTLG